MKYSEKGQEPQSLADWKANFTPQPPTFKSLSGSPKSETHNALLIEQGYVCAYCGRRLKSDRSDSHIDHFWPQNPFNGNERPDLRVDYANFFASCGPNSLPSKPSFPKTCGDAKGNWYDDNDYIIPSNPSCEQRFGYGPSGSIFPFLAEDEGAKNIIRELNLDDLSLRLEREAILTEIETQILNKIINQDNINEEINYWSSLDSDGCRKNFGHAASQYLKIERTYISN